LRFDVAEMQLYPAWIRLNLAAGELGFLPVVWWL